MAPDAPPPIDPTAVGLRTPAAQHEQSETIGRSVEAPHLAGSPAAEFAELMAGTGVQCALIGGYAVNAWVRPRLTDDFDFIVLGGRAAIERAEQQLTALGFSYVRKHDERGPSGPEFVKMRHSERALEIDLQVAKTDYQVLVVQRALAVVGTSLRVATPEDLIVLKLIAGRSKDNDDLRRLGCLEEINWAYVAEHGAEWGVEARLADLKAMIASETNR